MNLLLPSNLEEQPPYKQFLWLIAVVLAGVSIFSTILMAIMLAAGISPDSLAMLDLEAFSYGQLQGYKALQMLSTLGLFLLPAIAYSYLQTGNMDFLRLHIKIQPVTAGLTLLTIAGALPLVGWLGEINTNMQLPNALAGIEDWMRQSEDEAQKMINVFLNMNGLFDLFVNMIMVALLPAIAEEALFRGSLQPVLQRCLGNPHVAILLSAFVFSFIHLQFYGFLPRMALGVVLGYLFLFSQNLWYPILAHFVFNGLQVLLVYFFPNEIEKAASIPQTESVPLALVFVGGIVLTTSLFNFKRFLMLSEEGNSEQG